MLYNPSYILVIRMVREIHLDSLKVGRCVEHPKIYKVLQRSYKVRIIYFFRKFKSFEKFKSFIKRKRVFALLRCFTHAVIQIIFLLSEW